MKTEKNSLLSREKNGKNKFTKWAQKYPELKEQWDKALNLVIPQDLELDSLYFIISINFSGGS
ncbi:unnamed protein product [marine sediment metagenome]|uniref:Uncharacterized protein n=1 Tax=marine sediment metagenome TaxID=412755 RepID=X1Q242_9ZZZZ